MTPHTATLESGFTPLPLTVTATPPASVVYFKRFKMEADLGPVSDPDLPGSLNRSGGFRWLPWEPELLEAHAQVLSESFHDEIDSRVFASLGNADGCRYLMRSIVARTGFVPEATWLLACDQQICGSIQGIRERRGVGAIQNLGVLPGFRGQGLGALLMRQAMAGFARVGLQRVVLEVTAQNELALRLYRRLGFRRIKTLYKAVPVNAFLFSRLPEAPG